MSANGTGVSNVVRDAIYRATLMLDEEQWTEFLECCDESFHYAIRAFSPEINYDMTYFQGGRNDLQVMLDMLPKHNTDHSPLKRHVSVYTVDVEDDGTTAKAVSSFVIYQNMLDGINSHIDAGENRVFMLGRYVDTFKIDGDKATFMEREVRLDTRRLDKGSHYLI